MDRFESAVLRWDVARFLRQHTTDVMFTESNQVHVACPYCSGSKTRLYVNMRSKLWICQRCNRKGHAVGLVMLFARCSDVEAMKLITSTAPPALAERDAPDKAPVVAAELPEGFHLLEMPENDKSRPFWDYLINERKLSPQLVMKYRMGYVRAGSLKGRIVLPIYQDDTLVGYTARSLSKTIKMKYWVPPWCHTSEMLFNIDAVRGRDEAVLMEGQFDALRLPDRGVCTFGKRIGAHQIRLLSEAGIRRVILCYDGDAELDGLKFGQRLPEYIDVYKATLPAEYDPGDAPMLTLIQSLRDAVPIDITSMIDVAVRAALTTKRRR